MKVKNIMGDLEEDIRELSSKSPHGFVLDDYLVDLSRDVPNPIVLLYQESTKVPIFTEGSLSLILGASKSRKTTLAIALCAALLGKPMLGMLSRRKDYKAVIIDTEQGMHFSHMTARKIHKLMGWNIWHNNDRLKYYDLRKLNCKERRNFIPDVVDRDQPDVLFIDGIVDMCRDFNDNKESAPLIDEYLRLSAEYKMHICVCLHVNKDGKTARGHLGAMYLQKCETAFEVVFHEHYSEARPADRGCRHVPFERFCFQMTGKDALPALYLPSGLDSNIQPVALAKAKLVMEKIFADNGYNPIPHNELARTYRKMSASISGRGESIRSAVRRIKELTTERFINKDVNGSYILAYLADEKQMELEYPDNNEKE